MDRSPQYELWGWAGPSDRQIAQYQANQANKSQEKKDLDAQEHFIAVNGTIQELSKFLENRFQLSKK